MEFFADDTRGDLADRFRFWKNSDFVSFGVGAAHRYSVLDSLSMSNPNDPAADDSDPQQ
jgi:hypothetical protein